MQLQKYYWFIIMVFLLIILINYIFLYNDYIDVNVKKYTLHIDGAQIYENIFTNDEIEDMKNKCREQKYAYVKKYLLSNEKLKNLIKKVTSNDYIFQDYIWIIEKSSVHTCHRDNNGDFFNENQKYPSYTMLVYLEDMEKCLGIIPRSHNNINSNNINFIDPVINLPCKKGDIIIFNANLIHVGCINENNNNLRIQLKVTHKEDIKHINYYQNFNKILNKENNLPLFLRKGQKRFSCMFPILSNLTQNENIRTSRGSDNGVDIGLSQKAFSYLFYGNPYFYDLPNAF